MLVLNGKKRWFDTDETALRNRATEIAYALLFPEIKRANTKYSENERLPGSGPIRLGSKMNIT